MVIPGTLPYSGVLLAAVASPGLCSLPRSLWDTPEALKPPESAATPHPLAIPKHDLAAERPVDVQVYLRDVPIGDEASSFISCRKTGEEELASGTQTTACHQLPSWAGSPGATMVVCPTETSFLLLGGRGRPECPPWPWDLSEGLCRAAVGRR